MANLDQNKSISVPVQEDMNTQLVTFLREGKEQCNLAIYPMEHMDKNGCGVADDCKDKKLQDTGSSTFEKLQGFFKIVQEQHPESLLELQQVDGSWRVWCGVCKKLLRPDKSGKAIHNIQRQHFVSTRHNKKLHLMLQGEEEPKSQGKGKVSKSQGKGKVSKSRGKGKVGKDSGNQDNETNKVEKNIGGEVVRV